MALPDHKIAQRHHYQEEDLCFYPYNETNLQPASYDLRLGQEFRTLKPPTAWERAKKWTLSKIPFSDVEPAHYDPRKPDTIDEEVEMVGEGGHFMLGPDDFVLGHTKEVVSIPDNVVGVVHGRSSWARVGVNPHLGGYIDPGYEGQITLELSNLTQTPIKLREGDRFCQIALHELPEKASDPYTGKYQGDRGAESTRFHLDEEYQPPKVNTFFAQE
ncbi:trimeric dUTPase [Haloarcula californiae tailed virus 1]|uniref:Trimeric dUTPase n=1 Tax=Haloarcula californiae tailed virus 1 TaxID=1273746 RepID=R4TP42_9CAUD|nr:dCTP deaminase [Haloarcula californiae tailed virus 1]AGM12003.1 trimeric dUTPase [Haloarcula californiae tailed virus 1]